MLKSELLFLESLLVCLIGKSILGVVGFYAGQRSTYQVLCTGFCGNSSTYVLDITVIARPQL